LARCRLLVSRKYRKDFEPLLEGARFVPKGDVAARWKPR